MAPLQQLCVRPNLHSRFRSPQYRGLIGVSAQYAYDAEAGMTLQCGTMVTCDPIIRSLVTLFYPATCDPIIRSPATLSLYLHTPPCVPQYNGLHSTSLFKLPPCVPLNHCLLSTSLFKLPPPCVPPNHGLHSTSLFKLPPLRSTKPWSPFYFFI